MRLNGITRVLSRFEDLFQVSLTEEDRQALERMSEGSRTSDLAVQAVPSYRAGQELVFRIKEPIQQSLTDIAGRLERCDWDLGFLSQINCFSDVQDDLRDSVRNHHVHYRLFGGDKADLHGSLGRLRYWCDDRDEFMSRAIAIKLRLQQLDGHEIWQ